LHAAKAKLPHRIILFYSNRRPEDAAFLEELQALQQENPNYLLIATVTHLEKSRKPWQGEKGHICKAMLSRYAPDLDLPLYYIAGPPGMVSGLRAMLNDNGVDDDAGLLTPRGTVVYPYLGRPCSASLLINRCSRQLSGSRGKMHAKCLIPHPLLAARFPTTASSKS
jgi:hypothetical protein